MNASIDHVLRRGVESGDVPGVVAAATNKEGTIYEAALGKRSLGEPADMTVDTVVWIASMSKALTATAAMQLVEQGRLELDSPASNWVPDLNSVHVLDGLMKPAGPLPLPARNLDPPTPDDLSPVDEFRAGGREATAAFAE